MSGIRRPAKSLNVIFDSHVVRLHSVRQGHPLPGTWKTRLRHCDKITCGHRILCRKIQRLFSDHNVRYAVCAVNIRDSPRVSSSRTLLSFERSTVKVSPETCGKRAEASGSFAEAYSSTSFRVRPLRLTVRISFFVRKRAQHAAECDISLQDIVPETSCCRKADIRSANLAVCIRPQFAQRILFRTADGIILPLFYQQVKRSLSYLPVQFAKPDGSSLFQECMRVSGSTNRSTSFLCTDSAGGCRQAGHLLHQRLFHMTVTVNDQLPMSLSFVPVCATATSFPSRSLLTWNRSRENARQGPRLCWRAAQSRSPSGTVPLLLTVPEMRDQDHDVRSSRRISSTYPCSALHSFSPFRPQRKSCIG